MSIELNRLKAVREFLTPPERWTTGDFARTASGHGIDPRHRSAVCFCVLGAHRHLFNTSFPNVAVQWVVDVHERNPHQFNDNCVHHAEFLIGLDKVIAYAEKQEQKQVVAQID